MILLDRLFEEIEGLASEEIAFDADQFPQDIELAENEHVEWVASTFVDPAMIYLYKCWIDGANACFFSVYTSDGGVVAGGDGPWNSLKDGKASYAATEGWTT